MQRPFDFHPLLHQVVQHPYKKEKVGFGRIPSVDFRDQNFLLRRKALATVTHKYRYWYTGKVLDQGDTPQCVAYSGEGFLMAGPVLNKMWKTPLDLYNKCQSEDEWAGTPHDGSSVRALFKVLSELGYIKEYNWAFDVVTAYTWVLEHGPMVFGTDWLTAMFDPDAQGYIHASGNIEGGHAYLIEGASRTKRNPDGTTGAFRICNSWGSSWGQGGHCWISFNDAAKLLANYGEAATSIELKAKAVERQPTEQEREPEEPKQTSLVE